MSSCLMPRRHGQDKTVLSCLVLSASCEQNLRLDKTVSKFSVAEFRNCFVHNAIILLFPFLILSFIVFTSYNDYTIVPYSIFLIKSFISFRCDCMCSCV